MADKEYRLTVNTMNNTREAILLGSLEVFSHKGYVGATIGAIAKKAKVNSLTVFRHFQCKENLFKETIERFADIPLDGRELDRLIDGKTVSESLVLLSGVFFELMFKNIHTFRIYIIEATHFDFVKKMSWRMPPAFLAYLRDYFSDILPASPRKERRIVLLADMFLAHITRLTLQFNKHDSIWRYSPDLASAFQLKMKPQIEFFANFMLGLNAGNRVSVRLKAVKKQKARAGERKAT